MKKYLCIILINLLCIVKSQNSFEIRGTINDISSGEILLSNVFIPQTYYENSILKSNIENQRFSIKNKFSYPHAYRIIIERNLSGLIFLDKGVNSIDIRADSLSLYYPLILSNSKIYVELKNKFMPLYKKFIDKDMVILEKIKQCSQDSLNVECKKKDFELLRKNVHIQQDSIIFEYAKKNTNSYIPLWFIADKLNTFGFTEYQEKAFQQMSRSIKKTRTGIELEKDLNIAKYFSNGKLFPLMNLQKGKIMSSLGKKYTLIDFWFSHCAPCLKQMPEYKKIYDLYYLKGFEIISVSTDGEKYIPDWEKIIFTKKLNWKHLLDKNGIESKKYGINKFPTTFLLDKDGKILKKDLSVEELEKYLKENLN